MGCVYGQDSIQKYTKYDDFIKYTQHNCNAYCFYTMFVVLSIMSIIC